MTKRAAMSTGGRTPSTAKKPRPSEPASDSTTGEATNGNGGGRTLSRMPTDTSVRSSGTSSSSRRGGRRQTTCRTEEEERAELEREGIVVVDESGAEEGVGAKSSDDEMDVDAAQAAVEEEESSDAELERLRADWTSPVYAFYKATPEIVYEKGRRAHVFACLAKGCKYTCRRFLDTGDSSSTGNLRRHVRKCWGAQVLKDADKAESVAEVREKIVGGLQKDGVITYSFARKKGKVSYSHRTHTRSETRVEIVKWVTQSMRPHIIVKDPGFQTLMKTGRPGYWIPSASTVARDIRVIYTKCREKVARLLQEYEGELSFATDAWSSPNHHAFIAVTVHFVLNDEPVSMLLDLLEVAESHSGARLAEAFMHVLQDFGVEEKMLGLACDNVSANDVMTEVLGERVPSFEGSLGRVRCFAHVINLVVKTLLRQFDVPKAKSSKEVDEEDEELYELADGDDEEDEGEGEDEIDGEGEFLLPTGAEGGDDDEGWVDEVAAMTDEERAEFQRKVRPVRLCLTKKRVAELKLPDRVIPRDVSTRWNSTYDMLTVALEYRKVVDSIAPPLTNLIPSATFLARVPAPLLPPLLAPYASPQIFKEATHFFSRGTPNLATVIPAMDLIDQRLATGHLQSAKYDFAIRTAMGLAKKTLNKYYELTDASKAYRIAMVLHPSYKKAYFAKAGWLPEWIDVAEDLVRTQFNKKYAHLPLSGTGDEDEANANSDEDGNANSGSVPADTDPASGDDGGNMFDNLPFLNGAADASDIDELKDYLAADLVPVKDAISWWQGKRQKYPRLSRMAIDYLNIPATSVEVERIFSRGRLLLSHVRNRLTAESTRASICLAVWAQYGLVDTADMFRAAQLPEVEENE
ncbi:hypothetical protein VTO73DRAFT_2438 [Trametes versicolor]